MTEKQNSKVATLVIAGIDEQIDQLKDLIAELEKEKESYMKPALKLQLATDREHESKAKKHHGKEKKSQRVLIIEAIQRMPGKFDSRQIFDDVNNNKQGKPLVRESFHSIFSRLKKDGSLFIEAGEAEGKNLYEKITKK